MRRNLRRNQVMSSRVARKMSLKLLSCGRPATKQVRWQEIRGAFALDSLEGEGGFVGWEAAGSVEIEKELGQCRRESC